MSTEAPARPTTRLSVEAPYAFDRVSILQAADFRVVSSGVHTTSAVVAPGLYLARVRRADGDRDKLVDVGDAPLRVDDLDRSLAAPLAQPETPPALVPARNAVAPQTARVVLYADADVVDAGPARVASLDGTPLVELPGPGAPAAGADAPPGTWRLEHHLPGVGPRAHSVVLAPGFETQIFLTGARVGPDVRQYLRPLGSGYDRKAVLEYAEVDAALDGLLDRSVVLTAARREALAAGEGSDPLLALVAAWAAALARERKPTDELDALSRGALATVERLLAKSGDAQILRCVLDGERCLPIGEPPLLAVATERLLELAIADPRLVPEGSRLAEIAARLRAGTNWTRWHPEPLDASATQALRKQAAKLSAPPGIEPADVARLLGLPPASVPAISRGLKWVARSQWALWLVARTPRRLIRAGQRVRLAVRGWLNAVPRGTDALEPQVPPPADQLLARSAQRPGERSSRVRARDAGWPPAGKAWARGKWEVRLDGLGERRWRDFSWLTARALLDSANDRIAKGIHDLVDPERQRWMASQRAAGVLERFPDLTIACSDARRLTILGDPGEADASQYAVVEPMLALDREAPSDAMIVLSDVIYPAGDVNDYVNGFYEAYRDYDKPIVAIPGNHDWYDGLNGFMFHFCGAEALPPTSYRASSYTTPERVAKWLWRRASRPDRSRLHGHRFRRDARWRPQQPGPYWAMDIAAGVRLIGIDTGINGTLDREQGEWLHRVASGPEPKVLLTGKPIWVNGEYHPCAIDWGPVGPPGGHHLTVDDVVRDPAFHFVAAIGGDTHNYQRYSVGIEGGRRVEYVVAGGSGAYLSATHRIGAISRTEVPGSADVPPGVKAPTEADFRCYPTRGDSLAYYSVTFGRMLKNAFAVAFPTFILAALAGLAWELLLRGTPDPGLGRVMLAAAAGIVLVPAVLAGAVRLVHGAFDEGYRTAGVLLLVPALAVLGAAGLAELLGDDWSWAWRSALLALGVALLPLVVTLAGYYGLATEGRLRRDLLLCAGPVALAGLYLGDVSSLPRAAITVAAGLTVVALALRLLTFVRKDRRVLHAAERVKRTPLLYGPLVVSAFAAVVAIVLERSWDTWAAKAAAAALLTLVLLLAFAVLVVLLAGGRRALLDLARGGIDADQALSYLYEHGIVETLPRVTDPSRPARVHDFDYRTARICEFLLPGSAGIRRRLTALVSEVGNADAPPLFKSWLTLEVREGDLVLDCHAATGWAEHEGQPPREDSVVIPLSSGR